MLLILSDNYSLLRDKCNCFGYNAVLNFTQQTMNSKMYSLFTPYILFQLGTQPSSLQVLSLQSIDLESKDISILLHLLKKCAKLSDLNLGNNSIGDSDAKSLQGIPSLVLPSLKVINVSKNMSSGNKIGWLIEIITDAQQLSEINVGDNCLSDNGMALLTVAISENKAIKKVDLCSNYIGPKGAESIDKYLITGSKVEEILLNSNLIGKGAIAIGNAFLATRNLKLFSMNSCRIKDKGCITLSIGEEGGRAFSQALLVSIYLERLGLLNNKLKSKQ